MTRALAIICMLFAAAPALAEDAAAITLKLTPAEVAAIQRSMDRQPYSQQPPAGYWQLQIKLIDALNASPAARRAFDAAMK
jgi:hypothetical protein